MLSFDPRQEKRILIAGVVAVACALYAAAGWALFGSSGRDDDFQAGWILAVSLAMSYQTGYGNIRRTLGPWAFVLAFALPTALQSIGVAIRLVRIYS